MVRTSLTHPLRIAAVPAGPHMGRVGLTLCPGKVQPHAVSGPTERDLDIDLDAAKAWGSASICRYSIASLRVI